VSPRREKLQRVEHSKVDDLFRRASASFQMGQLDEAERLYKKVLRAQPSHLGALNLLGIILTHLGKDAEAERMIAAALRINARSETTQYNHGLVLKKLKRLPEALAALDQAIALNPNVADTWNSRGAVLNELKRYDEAMRDFDKAIALKPDLVDAFYNQGNALQGLKRYEAAIESYDRAITAKAANAAAFNNRGMAQLNLKRLAPALEDFRRALTIKPDFAESHIGCGDVLNRLGRSDEALAAYAAALSIDPQLPEGWFGRASVYAGQLRLNESLAAYDKALALKPDLASAWLARGTILTELQRYEEALAAFEKAVAIEPGLNYAEGGRICSKLVMSDLRGYDEDCATLLAAVRDGQAASIPFVLLLIPAGAEDQLTGAKAFIKDHVIAAPALWRGERYEHDRIRIGYLSYDMRQHAIGFLSVGLFEQHDKSRFETFAFSLGPDDKSATRVRTEQAFEHFHDVRGRSDQDIAQLMRASEIDIAVDLNGLTQGARVNVLAFRPAPIQVNYLGYPGTMGADYIDYIIADRTVIPEDQQQFYMEKVVYLPDAYQANDDRRAISDETPARAEAGLPDTGFVFCSFNNSFKITPFVFDRWMNLLRQVEGSVLWLLEGNPWVPANLRREAEQRGVSGDRLVFAPRTKLEDHLARHRLADLFLDTLPYNAHTTASDALWAGLPVVTCLGSTFAARVAASLLAAVGLPELVTHSLDDYEALALNLARDRDLLDGVKAKLADHRLRCPLFDTAGFTRHIEAAYSTMVTRHGNGEAPASFVVTP
jgi:protein O-GlcNAc transferase